MLHSVVVDTREEIGAATIVLSDVYNRGKSEFVKKILELAEKGKMLAEDLK